MSDKKSEPNFFIDPKSGVPFYKQIMLQIEMAIAGKRLLCGDQLPTVRSLAVELQVNPNTVAKAYSHLEIKGIVTTQQGSGTFIGSKNITFPDIERERILAELIKDFNSKISSYGFSIQEIIKYLQEIDSEK